jgi:dTDP-4-amino-4,6-dideoxygalactose transaminase
MSVPGSPDELAIFTGVPSFDDRLHVGRPNIGDRERLLQRINDILDRRSLTNNGYYVQELERRVAEHVGVRHCIAVCNATIGLELAIRAVGLAGEVILPAFTFVATAHALEWQQVAPLFCDIDPRTGNLDPARVEELITPRTRGIIGVHLWGRPCEIEPLTEIAARHGLPLIFDAAHAFGCTYRGQMIGQFGDAEVFSFHATKFINSFEGGAVVTNDDALAEKIRLMRNFGFAGYDEVIYVGTNGKMSEVSAAMGLTSIESLEEFVATNRRNYDQYCEELQGLPGVEVLSFDKRERCNYQYVVLDIDAPRAGIGRDHLMQVLWAEQVIARRYFYPGCHQMEPYRTYYPHVWRRLRVTERVASRVLLLPTGTAVTPEQISRICGILRIALAHGALIADRLESASRMGLVTGDAPRP